MWTCLGLHLRVAEELPDHGQAFPERECQRGEAVSEIRSTRAEFGLACTGSMRRRASRVAGPAASGGREAVRALAGRISRATRWRNADHPTTERTLTPKESVRPSRGIVRLAREVGARSRSVSVQRGRSLPPPARIITAWPNGYGHHGLAERMPSDIGRFGGMVANRSHGQPG